MMRNFAATTAVSARRALALAAALLATAATAGQAQAPTLEGAWQGTGTVSLASGRTETARCRASFSPRGANAFGMSATCSTPDVRVQQTASLNRVGPNRFTGEFQNLEFGVTGTIRITLNGNTLTAAMSSDRGNAVMSMRR